MFTPPQTYTYITHNTHMHTFIHTHTHTKETTGREERKASKQMGPGKAGNQVHPSAITTAAVTAAKTVVTTSAPGYSIALTCILASLSAWPESLEELVTSLFILFLLVSGEKGGDGTV